VINDLINLAFLTVGCFVCLIGLVLLVGVPAAGLGAIVGLLLR